MSKTVGYVHDVIVLRNSATAITATASTTAVTNARLRGMRGGMAIVAVHALDIASTDETYSIQVEGRDTVGSGSYESLGSAVSLSAAAASTAGIRVVNLDTLKKDMRVTATLGGTTPSLTYSVFVVVPQIQNTYAPNDGNPIT